MPHFAVSGAASFAAPDTVQALLSHRCDPNQTGANRYGPLHAVALFSRGNCKAVETAKLLLAHRADVNARTVLSGRLWWKSTAARAKTAALGFSNCNWAPKSEVVPSFFVEVLGCITDGSIGVG